MAEERREMIPFSYSSEVEIDEVVGVLFVEDEVFEEEEERRELFRSSSAPSMIDKSIIDACA